MKTVVIFLLAASLFCKEDQPVCRGALDLGSGKIKILVAEMDSHAERIDKVLYSEVIDVPLRLELAQSIDNRFSEATQDRVVGAISRLKAKAETFNPEGYRAIATESYRLAENGQELVNRIWIELGIPVAIVSQDEEAVLGYLTAKLAAPKKCEGAVLWEIGGGSFQITCKEDEHFEVFRGKIGRVSTRVELLKQPISNEAKNRTVQHVQTFLRDIPESILKKIAQNGGAVLGLHAHPRSLITDEFYDLKKAEKRLEEELGRMDPDPEVVADLILVSTVMEQMGIKKVEYVKTIGGSTAGILISPKCWEVR